MNSIRKSPIGSLVYDYLMITVGAILYVFALKVFITPMQIPSGGIAGLALLCNYILGLPFGVVTIVLNVPLLLFGYKSMGKDFFFKTLYMTVLSSVLTDLAGFLPAYQGDIMLAALFGGIIKGFGFGLVIRTGGTAGGSDVVSKYIYRKKSIPIGTTNMTLNVCVLLMSAYFLKSIESLLYGIITQYVVSVIMDHVIYGGDVQKEAMIITSHPEEIASAVLSQLKHGCTAIEGKGMYTGQERTILIVIIRRHETNQLKKLILDIDAGAFMMLSDTSEVLGRGFKHMKID